MSLTSNDLVAGATMPARHIYPRCGGNNISPQLSWAGTPGATRSFVLNMVDLDVKPRLCLAEAPRRPGANSLAR
jgi:hypothetical protein